MIESQKRANLEGAIDRFENIDKVFAEVEAKLQGIELDAEDIITFAINAEEQSEEMSKEVKALCRLVDSLRGYNHRVCELKTKLKEVTQLL